MATISTFLWMEALFQNRSVVFISLGSYGLLEVTGGFSSGQVHGTRIIIGVFLSSTKQQSPLVNILSLQHSLFSATVNEQITQSVLLFLTQKQETLKGKL